MLGSGADQRRVDAAAACPTNEKRRAGDQRLDRTQTFEIRVDVHAPESPEQIEPENVAPLPGATQALARLGAPQLLSRGQVLFGPEAQLPARMVNKPARLPAGVLRREAPLAPTRFGERLAESTHGTAAGVCPSQSPRARSRAHGELQLGRCTARASIASAPPPPRDAADDQGEREGAEGNPPPVGFAALRRLVGVRRSSSRGRRGPGETLLDVSPVDTAVGGAGAVTVVATVVVSAGAVTVTAGAVTVWAGAVTAGNVGVATVTV